MLLVSVTLLFPSGSYARDVDWIQEPITDIALWTADFALERMGQPSDGRTGFPTQGFDEHARDLIHGTTRAPNTTAEEARAREASDIGIAALIATTSGLGLFGQDRQLLPTAMTLVHTYSATNFCVTTVKYAVRRRRPKAETFPDGRQTVTDNTLSFPSGHAANAFAAATAFSLLQPESPWIVRTSFFVAAGFVGWARIAADRHYLTDVLMGAGIGIGAAILTYRYYEDDKKAVRMSLIPGGLETTWNF